MRSSRGRVGFSLGQEVAFARTMLGWLPVWALLLVALGAIFVAYQRDHNYLIELGTPRDQAYVRNFHARLSEGDRSYRWSDVYGYIKLPGLGGSRPFTVTLDLDAARVAPV